MPARGPVLLLLTLLALLLAAAPAHAAPLSGSAFDTGDGNQEDAVALDWQGASTAGRVKVSPDANDDCFVGGVKELAPKDWAFNRSAGGCTPGKSNLRVGYVNSETTALTSFGHFAFFRNDTTGNSFLTFELNQAGTSWTNATGTTIPCRSNGDLLLSFEVGGSTVTSALYKWRGDLTPAPGHPCPYGGTGTFSGSGPIAPGTSFQGAMNGAAGIQNFVDPSAYGALFPANAFGEAAVDLPAVLRSMGESPCFGFVQMQIHSRSSSSISSAMIDYTTPVPVNLQSCAATGSVFQDSNGNGTRDGGEVPLSGFRMYADADDDGTWDAGEPSGVSDATGFYRILDVPSGTVRIRQAPRAGWSCSAPSPCSYQRSIPVGGNSTGNDFGDVGPSTASGSLFDDLDGDGVLDAGEPGLGGVDVFADLDDDGVRDAGEPAGTSAGDGSWTVSDVPAGTTKLRPALGAGWTCSTPSPCSAQRTFTSGSAASGMVFGAYAAATIGGRVFEDADGDGAAMNGADAALSGWQVYADTNGNDAFDLGEPASTTSASGLYSLSGLIPGTYVVRLVPASASWYCTRPAATPAACEHSVTATSGLTAAGRDFGASRFSTVSGTVVDDTSSTGLAGFTQWVDYDGDNTLDANEPSAVSGSSGAYTITGVAAGTWTLRQAPNGAYACTSPSPCTYALAIGTNATVTARNFRDFVSRSISGTVFNDLNANATGPEAGEAGLEGWRVYYDANSDNAYQAGEPTSLTNSLGVYSLTGLPNGNYKVRVVVQGGWTCSTPAGCIQTGSIGSGQSDTGRNFGVYGPVTLSGTVFEDLDADGAAREAGEGGVSGRTVYVDNNPANGVKDAGEASATTDAAGAWSIAGLNPGTYTVRLASSAGWTCTRPAPTCAHTITTSAGGLSGRDFGTSTTGSIGGSAYADADADGAALEGGDTAISGRTIFLDANGNGSLDGGDTSTTTAGDGSWSFPALAPGTYAVRQVLPGGWTQSAPATPAFSVTVTSRSSATRAFASYTPGAIAGTAYEDADFDGSARVGGDPLLDGRDVYADLDDDGAWDAAEPRATTTGGGAYTLSGLRPGHYVVRPVLPAGWACSYPSSCSFAADVVSGATVGGGDFGSYEGADVAGTVFVDLDADGAAREAGEPGASARRVYLDRDDDGTRDADEPTTLTAADGSYAFSGLVARTWKLRLDLPAGAPCDSPVPCAVTLSLVSGQHAVAPAIGVHATGSIAGHLFTDRDADGGAQVFGENDQPERTVWLDLDDDGSVDAGEPTETTDDLGNFRFDDLQPGAYRVRQVLPAGWTCSIPSPCVHGVTLSSGDAVTGRTFSSWTPASFTGTYFEDADGAGDYPEPTDAALAGRTVYLDANGNGALDGGEPSTQTDADGDFSFTGLAPRSYVVRSEDQPADWTCSYPSPCRTDISLEAGEQAQDVNFGAYTDGDASGVVFDDADGDGVRDAGETGRAGVTVFDDVDRDGNKDASEPGVATGAGGAWSMTLAPGSHRFRQVVDAGWSCTTGACAQTVAVVSRGNASGVDFGNSTVPVVVPPADVSGTVVDDLDGDGAVDAGEPALPGVTVFLDDDDDGVADAGEAQAVTTAGGTYAITGLAAGTYRLRVDLPADRHCTGGCGSALTLAAGQSAVRDVATWQDSTVAGTVFVDSDANGAAREAGEPGAAGRSVFLDVNADGIRNGGEPQLSTAADGSFSFTGVAPGAYRVRIVVPAGWSCKRPAPCWSAVTVTSGSAPAVPDFGLAEDPVAPAPAPTPPAPPAPPAVADVQVRVTDAPRSTGGSEYRYGLTVHNEGPAPATGVVLTDGPFPGARVASATVEGGSCTVDASGRVRCVIGDMPVGADVRVAIVLSLDPGTDPASIATVASAAGNETDPAPEDNARPLALPPAAIGVLPTSAVVAPALEPCASERVFTVHLRRNIGRTFRHVVMTLGSKKLEVTRRAGRWTARVDLRGRAPGSYVLRITARTKTGKLIKAKRTYKTCVDRGAITLPDL